MSTNIYYNPNHESHLVRQNSLPTYDEAIRQVSGILHLSAPPNVLIANSNEHQYLDSDRRQSYQSHAQRIRAPLFDLPSRSSDVSTRLQQSATIQDLDAAVSQTNLEECERERSKNGKNRTAECIGLVVVVFLGIVLIVVKMSNQTDKLSIDSSTWTSQSHRHHWSH